MKKFLYFLIHVWVVVLIIALITRFLSSMTNFACTYDYGWLLRSGYYIIEHKNIPCSDLFSWTFPEKSWILYQWLFTVLFALAHKFLGDEILIRLFIVFVVLIYFFAPLFINKTSNIPVLFTMLISSLALIVVSLNMSVRPLFFTTIFLMFQYVLIQRYKENKIKFGNVLSLLVFVYILWGNIHTGVILGLLSLLLSLLGDFFENKKLYLFSPPIAHIEGKSQKIKPYLVLILFCFLGSLLNPYGFGIYTYLYNVSIQSYLNENIAELRPLDYHLTQYRYFAGLFFVYVILFLKSFRVFSGSNFLHLLTFTIFMFCVQRFVIWTCLYYVLILPKAIYQYLNLYKSNLINKIVYEFNNFKNFTLSCAVSVLVLFLFFPALFPPVKFGKCEDFRLGIESYNKLKLPSDRTFNDPHIGSCSILFHPEQKVFIDTRFDFYGQNFTKDVFDSCFLTSTNTNEFFNKWQINTFFIHKNIPLAGYLAKDKDNKKIYEDEKVVIFRKS